MSGRAGGRVALVPKLSIVITEHGREPREEEIPNAARLFTSPIESAFAGGGLVRFTRRVSRYSRAIRGVAKEHTHLTVLVEWSTPIHPNAWAMATWEDGRSIGIRVVVGGIPVDVGQRELCNAFRACPDGSGQFLAPVDRLLSTALVKRDEQEKDG